MPLPSKPTAAIQGMQWILQSVKTVLQDICSWVVECVGTKAGLTQTSVVRADLLSYIDASTHPMAVGTYALGRAGLQLAKSPACNGTVGGSVRLPAGFVPADGVQIHVGYTSDVGGGDVAFNPLVSSVDTSNYVATVTGGLIQGWPVGLANLVVDHVIDIPPGTYTFAPDDPINFALSTSRADAADTNTGDASILYAYAEFTVQETLVS